MRIKTLLVNLSLALFFLAMPQAARAQKEGEAHSVLFDANNHPTLKFTNKSVKRQGCGALVSYTLIDNQEEAIALRAIHLHVGSFGFRPSLPETGWLYITPSRIIFSVLTGDKSHAFNLPRKELKSTPVTSLGSRISSSDYVGIQIHLQEKLAASGSDTQKFVFSLVGDKDCYVVNSDPYTRFIKRAINDFEGTVVEFKRLADSLKQSGKSQQIPAYLVPPLNPRDPNAAPDGKVAPPVVVSPESGREAIFSPLLIVTEIFFATLPD